VSYIDGNKWIIGVVNCKDLNLVVSLQYPFLHGNFAYRIGGSENGRGEKTKHHQEY
jgi:hypothetical protein